MKPLLDRLTERINKTETCWLWVGYVRVDGYGVFTQKIDGKITPLYAHRLMYRELVGEIPDGFQVDHLCRVRNCVRPDHLEAVEPRENYRRGISVPAMNGRKAECKHGHAFTPENTALRLGGGRSCRECDRAKLRRRRARIQTEGTPS